MVANSPIQIGEMEMRMSWQGRFDNRGPRWSGSAEHLREEQRMRLVLDALVDSEEVGDESVPHEELNRLDHEMSSLAERAEELSALITQCEESTERSQLQRRLVTTNQRFADMADEYKKIRLQRK
jgi:uncharacterized protein YhaN